MSGSSENENLKKIFGLREVLRSYMYDGTLPSIPKIDKLPSLGTTQQGLKKPLAAANITRQAWEEQLSKIASDPNDLYIGELRVLILKYFTDESKFSSAALNCLLDEKYLKYLDNDIRSLKHTVDIMEKIPGKKNDAQEKISSIYELCFHTFELGLVELTNEEFQKKIILVNKKIFTISNAPVNAIRLHSIHNIFAAIANIWLIVSTEFKNMTFPSDATTEQKQEILKSLFVTAVQDLFCYFPDVDESRQSTIFNLKKQRLKISTNNSINSPEEQQIINLKKFYLHERPLEQTQAIDFNYIAMLKLINFEKTKKFEIPFVSYNGAIIFGLKFEQKKILEELDYKIAAGKEISLDIALGVGEGKTFLSKLIKELYGEKFDGSTDSKDFIIDGNYVGCSIKKIKQEISRNAKASTKPNTTTPTASPQDLDQAGLVSIPLSELVDLNLKQLTQKIQEVKKQLADKKSKIVIFDEFPHFDYDLRKYIRKMLPEKDYKLIFISATPNIQAREKLLAEEDTTVGRQKLECHTLKFIRTTSPIIDDEDQILEFLNSKDYLEGDLPVLLEFEVTNPFNKMSSKEYRIICYDQNNPPKIQILTPDFDKLEDFLSKKKALNITDALVEDTLELVPCTNDEIKSLTNEKYLPLSKTQLFKEDRKKLLLQIERKSKSKTFEIQQIDNDQNIASNGPSRMVRALVDKVDSFDKEQGSSNKSNVQFILPDLSGNELTAFVSCLYVDGSSLFNSIGKRGNSFDGVCYIDPTTKKMVIRDHNNNIVDQKQYVNYQDDKKRILMLYSSADAIGGDFGSFSRNVELQVVYTRKRPSISEIQQWTARHRKKDFRVLDTKKTVMISPARDFSELAEHMEIEQKSDELLDLINVLRNSILIDLGVNYLKTNDGSVEKIFMQQIRSMVNVTQDEIIQLITNELKQEKRQSVIEYVKSNFSNIHSKIEQYKNAYTRINSCRIPTEESFLSTGGSKINQHELKLKKMMMEFEVLMSKKKYLYQIKPNSQERYITEKKCIDEFNKKLSNCLMKIDKQVRKIQELYIATIESGWPNAQEKHGLMHAVFCALNSVSLIEGHSKDLLIEQGTGSYFQQSTIIEVSHWKSNLEQSAFELLSVVPPTTTNPNPSTILDLQYGIKSNKDLIFMVVQRILDFSKYSFFTQQQNLDSLIKMEFGESLQQCVTFFNENDLKVLIGKLKTKLESKDTYFSYSNMKKEVDLFYDKKLKESIAAEEQKSIQRAQNEEKLTEEIQALEQQKQQLLQQDVEEEKNEKTLNEQLNQKLQEASNKLAEAQKKEQEASNKLAEAHKKEIEVQKREVEAGTQLIQYQLETTKLSESIKQNKEYERQMLEETEKLKEKILQLEQQKKDLKKQEQLAIEAQKIAVEEKKIAALIDADARKTLEEFTDKTNARHQRMQEKLSRLSQETNDKQQEIQKLRQEKKELKETLQRRDNKIQEKKIQIAEKEAIILQIQDRNKKQEEHYQKQLAQLTEEIYNLQKIEKKYAALEQDLGHNAQLTDTLDELERQIIILTTEKQELEQKSSKIASMEDQITSLQENERKLLQELQELQVQSQIAQTNLQQKLIEDHQKKIQALLDAETKQLEKINEELAELRSRDTDLTKENEDLIQENKELLEKVAALEQKSLELNELKESAEQYAQEKERLETLVAQQEEELKQQAQSIKEEKDKSKELEQLKADIKDREKIIQELTEKLNEDTTLEASSREQLTEQISIQTTELEALGKKLTKKTTEYDEATKKTKELENNIDELNQTIQQLTQQNEESQKTKSELESRLKEKEEDIVKIEEQIKSLIEDHTRNIVEIEERIHSQHSEELKQAKEEMSSELEQLKRQDANTRAQLSAKELELQRTNLALEEAKKALEQSKLVDLKSQTKLDVKVEDSSFAPQGITDQFSQMWEKSLIIETDQHKKDLRNQQIVTVPTTTQDLDQAQDLQALFAMEEKNFNFYQQITRNIENQEQFFKLLQELHLELHKLKVIEKEDYANHSRTDSEVEQAKSESKEKIYKLLKELQQFENNQNNQNLKLIIDEFHRINQISNDSFGYKRFHELRNHIANIFLYKKLNVNSVEYCDKKTLKYQDKNYHTILQATQNEDQICINSEISITDQNDLVFIEWIKLAAKVSHKTSNKTFNIVGCGSDPTVALKLYIIGKKYGLDPKFDVDSKRAVEDFLDNNKSSTVAKIQSLINGYNEAIQSKQKAIESFKKR